MQTQELVRLMGMGGALVGLIFVGFVWLLFAAFDRWMGFQIRTANHQGGLYAEQLKLYPELVALMLQAAAEAPSARTRGPQRGAEAFQHVASKVHASQVAFDRYIRQSSYLLPDAVLRAAEEVCEAMAATADPGAPNGLEALQRAVIQAIRVCVGAGALGGETLKRVGPRQQVDTAPGSKAPREAAA